MTTINNPYEWQWPDVGPTPVSYGLDAEVFDTEKFPNAQTFVREAIQNSLDARVDSNSPVRVRFAFHDGELNNKDKFLADLRKKKNASSLPWPEEWDEGRVTWLSVQDFNSTGLTGDITSRTSDFWNYWLNFGLSNKSGAGRGGRGIGRVTFLIASRINTVIGLTQRAEDSCIFACGMSVLRPVEIDGELKTSYAYLAKDYLRNTFLLYSEDQFHHSLAKAFKIEHHLEPRCPGLSLVIPYPHLDLTPEKLVAASIENFAPAIANGSLIVEVDDIRVDSERINDEARRVQEHFVSLAMREDPNRLLNLIRCADLKPDRIIHIDKPTRFSKLVSDELKADLQELINSQERSSIVLDVPVTRNKITSRSPIIASFGRTQPGEKPVDLFYREGMALPLVTARSPADIDLVVQANEGELATYLNFCEGKAHLDLLENREVKDKLKEKGFEGVALKRFVRWLMDDIRSAVLPDATQPDATVMRGFFSVSRNQAKRNVPGGGGQEGGTPDRPNVKPPVQPPAPKLKPFTITALAGGFRVRANPDYPNFPVGLMAEITYATGERRPKWSKYDFELERMVVESNSTVRAQGNTIAADTCGRNFQLDITGFDSKRELNISISVKEAIDA